VVFRRIEPLFLQKSHTYIHTVKDFNFGSFTFFKQNLVKQHIPVQAELLFHECFPCEHQVPQTHIPGLHTVQTFSEVGLPKGKYF